MNTDKELSYKEYIMRESDEFHAPYNSEFEFYIAVRNGDTEKVAELCKTEFTKKSGFGELSDNPLQSIKYHFAITAAMIARYCIEGGMEHETAYSLSDLYIKKVDKASSFKQISSLHREMSKDYSQRMKKLRKSQIYSMPIVRCIDYIYDNLHKRILISELAKHSKISESYLSRLFKKETGQTVTEYISNKKIESAENMLKYSDYLPSEISNVLAFPNQSYFIRVFKSKTGLTPKKYRDYYKNKIDIQSIE